MPELLDGIKSAEPIEGDALLLRLKSLPYAKIDESDGSAMIVKGGGGLVADTGAIDSTCAKAARALVLDAAEKGTPDVRKLALARGLTWNDGMAARAIPYIASTEHVDAHGDIVRQAGWNFATFAKNSPMPYSHEWQAPPIGVHIDWRTVKAREENGRQVPALLLLSLFADAATSPFADEIFRLVVAGYLPGISVGFRPMKVLDVKDQAEREKLGLGRFGLVFEESLLLEASPTTIPANDFALAAKTLRRAKADGLLQPKTMLTVRELARVNVYGKSQQDSSAWAQVEANFLALAKELWPDKRFAFHRDLDVPVTLDADPTGAYDGIDPINEAVLHEIAALRAEVVSARATQQAVLRALGDATSDLRALCADLRDREDARANTNPTPEQRSGAAALLNTEAARLSRLIESFQRKPAS